MKAQWKNTVLAQSDDTVVVEGNHYFPGDSLVQEHFRPSSEQSFCPWKGTASYYDIVVDDEINQAAAWFYAAPKSAASKIANRVAFWRGIEVTS
jgi:uncharacterized protein (DUF427 family)